MGSERGVRETVDFNQTEDIRLVSITSKDKIQGDRRDGAIISNRCLGSDQRDGRNPSWFIPWFFSSHGHQICVSTIPQDIQGTGEGPKRLDIRLASDFRLVGHASMSLTPTFGVVTKGKVPCNFTAWRSYVRYAHPCLVTEYVRKTHILEEGRGNDGVPVHMLLLLPWGERRDAHILKMDWNGAPTSTTNVHGPVTQVS
ncbi:hypothetical protein CIHG_00103 [Coccidioides immitis H538.4]|uniref:Uncharacterized protein n=1 Tax=Coccidioides immitis H538.4 TaxID=396776 RepID=A0A0J8RAV3_COCIT|nr:hypothetical protein CIHG_00103 [Coccidioides immitis H538.4]